ncbi:hypothetical protein [Rheinheimera sp.]|uniref:hypothetical protein n=1 Tax=Rheinheimera sp. TaxID=1869214 RepID=UPI00307DCAA1
MGHSVSLQLSSVLYSGWLSGYLSQPTAVSSKANRKITAQLKKMREAGTVLPIASDTEQELQITLLLCALYSTA